MSENLILKREGETSVVTWIKRRIKRNQNCISITTGPTGSGKSYANISLCMEIDPEFNVERQVVFKLTDLMRLINDDWFKKLKWKQIIFEELQVTSSNRSWQSAVNKMLNYLLSTFRHQNIILYFNAPYQDFIDSQSLKLVHMILETRGVNRKTNLCKIAPKLLQYNAKMKKYYEHRIHAIYPNNKIMTISVVNVMKPTQEACKIYEDKKKEFTDNLNKDIMKQALELERGKDDDKIDKRKPLTEKQREILLCYKKLGQGKLVAKEMNLSQGYLSTQLKLARNKGYRPEDMEIPTN